MFFNKGVNFLLIWKILILNLTDFFRALFNSELKHKTKIHIHNTLNYYEQFFLQAQTQYLTQNTSYTFLFFVTFFSTLHFTIFFTLFLIISVKCSLLTLVCTCLKFFYTSIVGIERIKNILLIKGQGTKFVWFLKTCYFNTTLSTIN